MAISATQVWEVEGGTGSDSNGGGFDPGVTSPGTDYSKQASPHVAFNGSTISATASGASATIVITGYTVATTDVGNTVQITGGTGFLTGFFTIISVSVGSVTWTLDRNCTSGAATGLTANMGGALNTIGKAVGVAVGSNTIWVKASATYTITSTLTLSFASNNNATQINGYTTTRGDNGQATIACSTNSVHIWTLNSGANDFVFRNIKITNTAGTPGDGYHFSGSPNYEIALINCYISGCNFGVNASNSGAGYTPNLLVDSCEITACKVDGVSNAQYSSILNSYIHGNTGCGVKLPTAGTVTFICNCVIKSNAGAAGVFFTSNQQGCITIINCCLINNAGDGYQTQGSSTTLPAFTIQNCIIDSNGGFGINSTTGVSSAWGPLFRNNAFGSGGTANTSGNYSSGLTGDSADVTLTGDPFNNRSGGDFSLNGTAGAGAACKGAGYDFGSTGY